jgi:hypothetical protein
VLANSVSWGGFDFWGSFTFIDLVDEEASTPLKRAA